jgi:hypothetical protein
MKAKSSQHPSLSKNEPGYQGNYVDAFVKQMFSRFIVFVDFLMFYADQRFVSEIDLMKIEPAPTHYIGKFGDERIADLVFQCPLKAGNGNMMAVIVFEHQSGSLKKIPQKLHKYISAIWDAETKEGKKILSAPYFIVLRTAKKPHRGKYPKMVDLLPKGRDGKPLGMAVEIEYDVVDLPARDFYNLVGGAVLRAVLGILKKMLEGHGDEFGEALLPLREITDPEQRIEITNEMLLFADRAFAAHNRRLDMAKVKDALDMIFPESEKPMIKTLYEVTYDEGFVEGKTRGITLGEARGEAKTIVRVLKTRFNRVPKTVSDRVLAISDSVVLESLTDLAVQCQSLKEFKNALQ